MAASTLRLQRDNVGQKNTSALALLLIFLLKKVELSLQALCVSKSLKRKTKTAKGCSQTSETPLPRGFGNSRIVGP